MRFGIVQAFLSVVLASGPPFVPAAQAYGESSAPAESASRRAAVSLIRQPLHFEPAEQPGRFVARGAGYALALDPSGSTLVLRTHEGAASAQAVVRMTLVGADESAIATGLEPLASTSNYYVGKDRAQWRRAVTQYARVEYGNVYPGIALVHHGSDQRQLEYDFVVSPGADPALIRLRIAGAKRVRLDREGNLVIETAAGHIVERAPVVYQELGGTRQPVAGRFVKRGRDEFGFAVTPYDRRRALVIDPVLVYSTYLGGSGGDYGFGVAVDAAGNTYVIGTTDSSDFPTVGPPANPGHPGHPGPSYNRDAFVSKLDPQSHLVYSTYLAGGADDWGWAIAVDPAGNVYVAGETSSSDFPITANASQPAISGNACYDLFTDLPAPCADGFVAKLDAASGLVYSTFLGGIYTEYLRALAVDSSGNVYVTGSGSPDFPRVGPQIAATPGAFVTKLDPASALVYSTFIGPVGTNGIAVDAAGSAYLVGYSGPGLTLAGASAQPVYGGGSADACVMKIDATPALVYSTHLGGASYDEGRAIALDSSGGFYVTGVTTSANFPLAGTPSQSVGGVQPNSVRDAFVTRFDANGAFVYSTFLGGSNDEWAYGIAVDGAENAYVAGFTRSTDFPTAGGGLFPRYVVPSYADAFVTRLDPTSALAYSTYLGGTNEDIAQAIAVEPSGRAHIIGFTTSQDFPVTGSSGPHPPGLDAFVVEFDGAAADLRLTLAPSPSAPPAGGALDYAITVTNDGPEPATSVQITDTVPPGLAYVSGPAECMLAGGRVTCALGTLAVGEDRIVTLTFTVTAAAGTIVNSATATTELVDPVPSNSRATSSTTVAAVADLAVSQTHSPAYVLVGGNQTYTVTVTNNGPSPATGITVTDALPATSELVSASAACGLPVDGVLSCDLGSLASGASTAVVVVVRATATGALTNTASVSHAEIDPVSANDSATDTATAYLVTVNSAADHDDGSCDPIDCTLREAINFANASSGLDTIAFAIPGPNPHTISLPNVFPSIRDSAVLDATTQPGYAGSPVVELNVVQGHLRVEASNCTIRGFAINGGFFFDEGIELVGSHNHVEGNFIGTDVTGTMASGQLMAGIRIQGSYNTIGGPTPSARNVIGGVSIGILSDYGQTTGTVIQGNYIGTDVTGTQPLTVGNGVGIDIRNGGNLIGGTVPGAGNILAFNPNGYGITIGGSPTAFANSVLGNSIFGNYRGIVIQTPRQSYPALYTAASDGSTTMVSGAVSSAPGATLRVEFFANDVCNVSGYGEGKTFLGFANVTTDPSGLANFAVAVGPAAPGQVVTATATDPAGNTSLFSACLGATPAADLAVVKTGPVTARPGDSVTYTITVSNGSGRGVVGAAVSDPLPAVLTGASWTCSASAGASCGAGGTGSIADGVSLPPGGVATYTLSATVDLGFTGTLTNTASVVPPAGIADPNPANDNASWSTTVSRIAPVVTWAAPAAITYGTPLDATQLSATANVPGAFAYAPPAGTVVDAGVGRVLSVTFTPEDAVTYGSLTVTTVIDVAPIASAIALTSSEEPGLSTRPIVLTATVEAPVGMGTATGNVEFLDGGVLLGRALLVSAGPAFTATFPTAALTVAGSPHAITGRYIGDGNVNGSTSSAISQTIDPGSFSIVDLGTLGGPYIYPTAINARGEVTGISSTGSGDHAFLYSGGTMTDLGTLGGMSSVGYAINGEGDVVGYSFMPGDRAYHAFLSHGGTMTDLGTLGGDYSYGAAINSRGDVAGDSYPAGVAGWHLFRYRAGIMTDLGTLGGVNPYVTGMNESGDLAGNFSLPGISHGFLFRDGTMTDLGTVSAVGLNNAGWVAGSVPAGGTWHAVLYDGTTRDLGTLGGTYSTAAAVNDAGQVAGMAQTSQGDHRAFLYRDGTMSDLGTLGGRDSWATGLNSAGAVVGSSWVVAGSNDTRAFAFTAGQMINLDALIPGSFGSTPRISDSGQIVMDAAMTANGTFPSIRRTFLLTPAAVTTLTAARATGPRDGAATLSATLTSRGAPLSGRTVSFTLSGAAVGSAVTDGAGVATLTASVAGLAVGTYPGVVRATFHSDASYASSSGSADLEVVDPTADLVIVVTDGQASAVPGLPLTYILAVTNAGPARASGAIVTDVLPTALAGATWTCAATGGATCAAAGSGNIGDTVDLPAAASLVYTIVGTVDPAAAGTLTLTAAVTVGAGTIDPNASNNTAMDSDTLAPRADLAITKTDGLTTAIPGQPLTYTLTVGNAGPSTATGATVADALPAALIAPTWTCAATGGAACAASGTGSLNDSVSLPPGGGLTYQVAGTISLAATGTLNNTATVTVPAGVADPTTANNSATDSTTLAPAPVLTVTAPNTAVTWRAGTTQTITWTQNLGAAQTVRIELSRNDLAGPWETLATVPATAGSFAWAVTGPGTDGARARVRVSWTANPAVNDASNVSFTLLDRVNVASPNTAVAWTIGTIHPILWGHNIGAGALVNVSLSRDGGTTWELIAASVPNASATAGGVNWTVTGPATTQARVRVTSVANPAFTDQSDVVFTLVAASLTVTAPNTAVLWRVGDTQSVTFTHNLGTGQPVKLEVARDGGSSWGTITTLTTSSATTGSFVWTVSGPPTLGADGNPAALARIRVSWVTDPGVADEGDASFTILSRITVAAPNAAGSFGAGSRRTYVWTHNLGLGSLVNIHASLDGGATWQSLATGVANASASAGSFTGPLPTGVTTQARIRVTSASDPGATNPSLNDRSDVNFTIATAAIVVAAPTSPVSWAAGTVHNIVWIHNLGTSESVRIEVTTNYGTNGAGAVWTPIATVANTTATAGVYAWTVPPTPSSQCRIRVTWTSNAAVTATSTASFTIP